MGHAPAGKGIPSPGRKGGGSVVVGAGPVGVDGGHEGGPFIIIEADRLALGPDFDPVSINRQGCGNRGAGIEGVLIAVPDQGPALEFIPRTGGIHRHVPPHHAIDGGGCLIAGAAAPVPAVGIKGYLEDGTAGPDGIDCHVAADDHFGGDGDSRAIGLGIPALEDEAALLGHGGGIWEGSQGPPGGYGLGIWGRGSVSRILIEDHRMVKAAEAPFCGSYGLGVDIQGAPGPLIGIARLVHAIKILVKGIVLRSCPRHEAEGGAGIKIDSLHGEGLLEICNREGKGNEIVRIPVKAAVRLFDGIVDPPLGLIGDQWLAVNPGGTGAFIGI